MKGNLSQHYDARRLLERFIIVLLGDVPTLIDLNDEANR